MALFSVISPFYNVEQYAKKCIESVLNQTERDFEYILVDDGSKDNIPKMLDEYAFKDSRIKVIHKENGGIVSARKAGAEIASGDYIVIVDGDDWLHEQCLEKLKQVLISDFPELVMFGYFKAYEGNKYEAIHVKSIGELNEGLIDGKNLHENINKNLFAISPTVWAKAFKREIYIKYQMALDNRISMGEDGAVVYPLLCMIKSVYLLNESLYYYYQNPQSMTHHSCKNIPLESVIIRLKHFEQMLPEDLYEKDRQLARYACHAFMNAAISQFKNKKFTLAKKAIKYYISDSVMQHYLKYSPIYASKIEKLSYFALKYHMWWMIKIYSLLI